MLHIIFKNGWEDKNYIKARVYGMDKIKEEVLKKWTPEEVHNVTGVPPEQLLKVTEAFAKNRPSTIVWCMGQTQHTIGNAVVRASCILQLASATSASQAAARTSSAPRQRAGRDRRRPQSRYASGLLPGRGARSWTHWARVWNVDLKWLQDRFARG